MFHAIPDSLMLDRIVAAHLREMTLSVILFPSNSDLIAAPEIVGSLISLFHVLFLFSFDVVVFFFPIKFCGCKGEQR